MSSHIHFVHGNGFPSSCYRQILEPLRQQYRIDDIDMIGVSDAFFVTQNWPLLVDELIENIRVKSKEPVIAMGHSLGGVLSLLASYKAPSLIKLVIMLDSLALSPSKSMILRIIHRLGLIDYVTPARRAKRRQTHWGTKEEAKAYLSSRELFRGFHHQCLDDFVEFGLEEDNKGGVRLRYCREHECKIYRTIPYNMPNLKRRPKMPVVLIYGEDSDIIRPYDIRYMAKVGGFQTILSKGSHMFPMEYPKETVENIHNAIHIPKT